MKIIAAVAADTVNTTHANTVGQVMSSNTPAAQPDELDDIDRILATFAHEKTFPEVIKQYAGYAEAKAAIKQHEAAAVAKARIESQRELIAIGTERLAADSMYTLDAFLEDAEVYCDTLQRHAQEGGVGE